jgi:hypothetical protein
VLVPDIGGRLMPASACFRADNPQVSRPPLLPFTRTRAGAVLYGRGEVKLYLLRIVPSLISALALPESCLSLSSWASHTRVVECIAPATDRFVVFHTLRPLALPSRYPGHGPGRYIPRPPRPPDPVPARLRRHWCRGPQQGRRGAPARPGPATLCQLRVPQCMQARAYFGCFLVRY